MRSIDDDTLLERTPSDPAAFAEFYRRHEALVFGYLMRRTRDPELTADLAAETFASALLAARRYVAGRAPAEAWLLGIARHKMLRSFERGRVESGARERLGLERLELDDEELQAVASADDGVRAELLLASLPDDQAEAIRGRVLDEDEYAVLAARLKVSESTARKRVSRGLQSLRRLLKEAQ
jgi:RNA polymerase sigma factor (sigma-70 family)